MVIEGGLNGFWVVRVRFRSEQLREEERTIEEERETVGKMSQTGSAFLYMGARPGRFRPDPISPCVPSRL